MSQPIPLPSLISRLEVPEILLADDETDLDDWRNRHAESLSLCEHALSIEEWRELLELCHPKLYAEPPGPDEPAFAMTTQSRVEVYRQRVEQGLHLYHDEDLWRDDQTVESLHCSLSARRCRNGEDAPEEDLVLDREIVTNVNERGQIDETELSFRQ